MSICFLVRVSTRQRFSARMRGTPKYIIFFLALSMFGLSNSKWTREPEWLTAPNEARSHLLTRHPRFLVFTNTGIIKLIVGFGIPVELRKRTLLWLTNLQFQYFTPVNYSQLFPMTINKKRSSPDAPSLRAIDRTTIYEVIRMMMERKGIDGRACIMRAICEAAETPLHHNGLVGEVMHMLFTPDTSKSSRSRWRRGASKEERFGEDTLDEDFFQAQFLGEGARRRYESVRRVGRSAERVDEGSTFDADVCSDGFPSCPNSILDTVSVLLQE